MRIIFVALILMCSQWGEARELFPASTSVRALGMGNAYIAAVQDADALFYNPAGLARITGINWTVADFRVGLNGDQILDTVADMQGSSTFEQTIRNMYGDHIWVGGGGKTAVTLPGLGAAVYTTLDASVDVDNPVYPNLDLSVINDLGYTLGGAVPLSPFVQVGAAVRYVKRTGSRVPFGPSYISSLDPDAISDSINKVGSGYGMDLGMNIGIPGPVSPVFSFVWRNVGITKFDAADITLGAPPSERDEMSIGASLNIDAALVSVMPVFEFKFLNRDDVQLGNKIHLGVEIDMPILDIRAGFNQGYYTAGAGLDFGLFRFDVATYGVELGEYPGQREDRRYVLQFTMELGFDLGINLGGGDIGGASSKAKSGSSSSSSSSGWGGRKLKRRR